MVDPVRLSTADALAAKVGTIMGNAASVVALAIYVMERSSRVSSVS